MDDGLSEWVDSRRFLVRWQTETIDYLKAIERDPDAPLSIVFGPAKIANRDPQGNIVGAFSWTLQEMAGSTSVPQELRVFNNLLNIGFVANARSINVHCAVLCSQANGNPYGQLKRSPLAPTTVLQIEGDLCVCWSIDGECREDEWFAVEALVRKCFGYTQDLATSSKMVLPLPGFDVLSEGEAGAIIHEPVETIEINPARRYTSARMLKAFRSAKPIRRKV